MIQQKDQTISRDEFLRLANNISSDPLSRVPASVHPQLDPTVAHEANEVFIDVHAHSFTLHNVPSNFIKGLKIFSRSFKNKILKWINKDLSRHLGQEKSVTTLNVLYDTYIRHFQQQQSSPKVFIVNLMMDMQRGIGGKPPHDFMEQFVEVVEMRNNNNIKTKESNRINYTEQLLPFLAVDPHNEEIYAQFLTAFDSTVNKTTSNVLDDMMPFVGIKIYTTLGYLPTHPILMDIFEVCEKKNIPIVTHVGGYRTKTEFEILNLKSRLYHADGSFNDREREVTIETKEQIKDLLIQPMHWEKILQKFPKLKVCFAHMGDKDEWTSYRKNPNDPTNHVHQTLKLIKKYNAFADVSFSYTIKANADKISEFMRDSTINDNILYGSDFYMTEVEGRKTNSRFEYLHGKIGKNSKEWQKMTDDNIRNFLFGVM